ncbi:alpha-1,6-rhamnosyltransferase MigA [Novosphingobium nitrogenifigens DSM 19370]|uniref:Alpha-1,6-rhamnosyltransferase MigA n=1 Tax=Novosphingobium nitrogenifigens DSM 19370 TaxID=983920 RepID=F1Z8M4_9SPHN|nr:glycosyltransferase family A protein [Novosphingobium nitrogenifigens]EGD59001.1 alpha-1,6-rhamnosyltransferase MigA [Novosphingobium nitrogenifigens DSM 19370]
MSSTSPRVSLVLPYYNEENFILPTLKAIAAQDTRDFRLIIVNNRSSDASPAMVEEFLSQSGLNYLHVVEETPGVVSALMKGISLASGDFITFLNADTIYPPHYVSRVIELFDANPTATSVMAIDIYGPPESAEAKARLRRVLFASRMLPKKCHAGTYAQSWRLAPFRAAGGFDTAIWPYVLEDHEIMVRMMDKGPSIYDERHYCFPSPRRTNSTAVSWNGWEKIAYGLLPARAMPWFFYSYLAGKFARRKMMSAALRNRSWE